MEEEEGCHELPYDQEWLLVKNILHFMYRRRILCTFQFPLDFQ